MCKQIIALFGGLIISGLANANLIINGDFEAPQLSGSQWQVFGNIPGWNTTKGPGIEIQRNTIVTAQSGNQYVELDSHYANDTNSTMSQAISTIAGQAYTLSFWYRPRTSNGGNDNGINVYWDVFGGDFLSFSAANEVLSLDNYVRSQTNHWLHLQVDLIASNPAMALSFAADGDDNSLGGFVDNVSLVAKVPGPGTLVARVPEPGTLALLGLGMASLALRRRTK